MITLCAAIFFAYAVYVDYECLTQDASGVNTTKGLLFVGGVYLVSAIVYFAMATVRRKQQIDTTLIYKELPVE